MQLSKFQYLDGKGWSVTSFPDLDSDQYINPSIRST